MNRLALFITLAFPAFGGAELPKDWHGVWEGQIVIATPAGKPVEVPMTLEVGPRPDGKGLVWKATMGEGPRKVVKNYGLFADPQKAGHFTLDENNGIELPARLIGGVLHFSYTVGKSLHVARYELRDGVLHYELAVASAQASPNAKAGIQTFAVTQTQSARLKKK